LEIATHRDANHPSVLANGEEESTLRKRAAVINAKRLDDAIQAASAKVKVMDRVGTETKSSSLQEEAATFREMLGQLKDAARDFPLLTKASPEQQKVLDELKARGGKHSVYIYLDNAAWKTPLDGILKCNMAGELELGRLAGKSILMPEEEARLRDAMGDKFDSFRKIGLEQHAKEQQRVIERRGEYEHPEVEHSMEHPVL
jgi:hypothetical protein